MSISQPLNNSNAKTQYVECLKLVIYKNLHALKTYWPLILLSQLPLVYNLSIKNATEHPIKSSKVEAKNLDILKQKYLTPQDIDKKLKYLNERFMVLQTQHSKIVKNIIAIQEKQQSATYQEKNSETITDKNETSIFEIIEKIGDQIKNGEPYTNFITKIPSNLKNNPAYEMLNKYASKTPPTFNDLIKAFEEINKNHAQTQETQNIPRWLEKLSTFFNGEIKITKGNNSAHSPFEAIKEALTLRDFQLALDAAQYTNLPAIKKWAKPLEERLQLEQHYQLFAEQVSNITLEKQKGS